MPCPAHSRVAGLEQGTALLRESLQSSLLCPRICAAVAGILHSPHPRIPFPQ